MKQIVIDIIKSHKKLVAEYESRSVDTVVSATEMIAECLRKGGCVYLCGNGGSAADAQHIAGEFVGRFMRNRKALPAVAFTTDTSVLTCVANDYSFEDVFTRQVEAMVKPDDVLWAFSTSGTSGNVVAAAKLAKDKGASVLAFTGKPNTPLEKIADLCLCADAGTSFAAQEIHQLAYHTICELIDREFSEPEDTKPAG